MKDVVIFTVGFHARATFRALRRRGDCRVLGFVDNNRAVQGTTLFDLPVMAPSALTDLDFDLVALPGRNQDVILGQLRGELGIEPARIWSVRKGEVRPAADELARRGEALARLLRQTLAVLEAAGADYWAMHSGLLGIMRGDDLALFSDLDFCVDAIDLDALETRFAPSFNATVVRRRGDEASGTDFPHSRLLKLSLEARTTQAWDEPAMIDFHPLAVGPTEARWLIPRWMLNLPSRHFRDYELATYRGVPVRVPLEPDQVLSQLYGADWRVPAETWNGRYAATTIPSVLVAN